MIVSQLKEERRHAWELHQEVYLPWSNYDSVDSGDRYLVKRIEAKWSGKLRVQKTPVSDVSD